MQDELLQLALTDLLLHLPAAKTKWSEERERAGSGRRGDKKKRGSVGRTCSGLMSLETTSSLWFAIISTLTRYWAFSGITLTSWGSACDAADGAQGEVSVSTTFVPLFVFILVFFFRSPSDTREARLGRTRPARTGKAGRAFLPLALPPIPDRAARSDLLPNLPSVSSSANALASRALRDPLRHQRCRWWSCNPALRGRTGRPRGTPGAEGNGSPKTAMRKYSLHSTCSTPCRPI